ncbi:hypothetical protein FNF28_06504 [Cafeteria roenbergensis]|nr:hypothetical protein FNF28_06504 [Cafeteria roenbergensis]
MRLAARAAKGAELSAASGSRALLGARAVSSTAAAHSIPDLRADWDPWEKLDGDGLDGRSRSKAPRQRMMFKRMTKGQRAALAKDERGQLTLTDATVLGGQFGDAQFADVPGPSGSTVSVADGKAVGAFLDNLHESNPSRQRARRFIGPKQRHAAAGVTQRSLLRAREPHVSSSREHNERDMASGMANVRDSFAAVRPEEIGDPTIGANNLFDERAMRRVFRNKDLMSRLGLAPEGDEEEWHQDERRARPMPHWMFIETAREDLSYEFNPPQVTKAPKTETFLVRHAMTDAKGRAFAVGGRKNAKARVCVQLGDGRFNINGRPLADYFPHLVDRKEAIAPLMAVYATGAFDIDIRATGGGHSGQAGAIKHGLARALARFDPYLRLPLRRLRLLTRDPRVVERKKIGRTKARRRFQWVKR